MEDKAKYNVTLENQEYDHVSYDHASYDHKPKSVLDKIKQIAQQDYAGSKALNSRQTHQQSLMKNRAFCKHRNTAARSSNTSHDDTSGSDSLWIGLTVLFYLLACL